jgi:hypothetical protein
MRKRHGSSRIRCVRSILIFSIISVSIQSFLLSFEDETFVAPDIATALKIKYLEKNGFLASYSLMGNDLF